MKNRNWFIALAACVTGVGCSAHVIPMDAGASDGTGGTTPVQGTGGASSNTGEGTGGASAAGLVSALSQCTSAPQGVRSTPMEADFRALVFGDWALCKSPSVFGTTDEIGLEISPDGRWHKLMPSGDSFTLAVGWGNEGSWQIIDTSVMNGPGVFQLNLSIDGSGTVITMPVFAQTPDLMRLNNEGVYAADYIRIQ